MPFLAALAVFGLLIVLGLRGKGAGPPRLEVALRPHHPRQGAPSTGLANRVEAAIRVSGLRISVRQVFLLVAASSLLLATVALRFFGSVPIALVIGGAGAAYSIMRLRQFEQKRKETLAVQFKEALTSITYSLRSGASLQSALEQALTDLLRIFPSGPTEPIVQELQELVQQLRLGVPVEVVLAEWAERVRLEEVTDFVSATLAVKTRGGNLADVMVTISEIISWKIVGKAQIRALTAEKRSEANMLIAAPSVVLVLLSILSPQYMAPLFGTGAGQIILLAAVLCNMLAFFAVRKVLESPL